MKILEQIENETKKINSNIYNFSFSSDEMDYKSMLIGFNKNLYSLFNSHYMNLNISKSIKDLFMGEIVNETENQSALHHVYRDLYAEKSNNFLSEELLKTCSINIEKCIELKEILINKGIKSSRIKAEVFGESVPEKENLDSSGKDDPQGRKFNRRVVLAIYDPSNGQISTGHGE